MTEQNNGSSSSGTGGHGAAAAARLDLEPDINQLQLGYRPLTDCAPLVIAKEKGFFSACGLDVELVRESSWANIRDKVAVGALDGAHMLAGTPLAVELGISPVKEVMQTSFSMDLNGNGITVSLPLLEQLLALVPEMLAQRPVSAAGIARVVTRHREQGLPPLRFAMVSRYSRHNYELRYWLAAAGVHPDRDVDIIVVPPPAMVDMLESGRIDGFCVSEPWNSVAVRRGAGCTLISSYEIWNNGPEKVLGHTRRWAERHPNSYRLLIAALLGAARWLDEPANRGEAADLLAGPAYLNLSRDTLAGSLGGRYAQTREAQPVEVPDFNVFHRYAANFPWRSHAAWFLLQMYRWGQIEDSVNVRSVAEAVYRPEPFREVAAALGMAYPLLDYKAEGRNQENWTLERASQPIVLGPDRFFDGAAYDPDQLVDYLAAVDLHSMKVSLSEISLQNP